MTTEEEQIVLDRYAEATDRRRRRLVEAIVAGFNYDPGHSDLDDDQPIHVRMTLGDYRAACHLNRQPEPGPEPVAETGS